MISDSVLKFKGEGDIDFILIHGLTGSPGEFLQYIPHLKTKGNIYLVSLPGHGQLKSIDSTSITYQKIMNSFFSFLEDLKPSKKIFVAHSLGGFLLNDQIFKLVRNNYRMFFVSPVIGEELIMDEYEKVYNKLSLEQSEDFLEPYKNLRIEINENISQYFFQKETDSHNHIINIFGKKDKLISTKYRENLANDIFLDGSHNLHIELFEQVVKIILLKV